MPYSKTSSIVWEVFREIMQKNTKNKCTVRISTVLDACAIAYI